MLLDLSDDESTLVKVMAWCHQATSHYLNQCWPRSVSSYGVTKLQWVKHRLWVIQENYVNVVSADDLAPKETRPPTVMKVHALFWFIHVMSSLMAVHCNSLCPSDAIWWHKSVAILAQVMAHCLMTPSHYLSQCWVINKGHWHWSEGIFKIRLKIACLEFNSNLPGANEFIVFWCW